MSGVSSTAAAAPNSESATSNFIVLRARCRRCVVERRKLARRFNPNAIEKLWAAQRVWPWLFTAIFGLLYRSRGLPVPYLRYVTYGTVVERETY